MDSRSGELTLVLQSPVFRVVDQIVILKLGESSRLSKLESLRDEFRPILDGSGQIARVDDVEFLAKGPRFFAIIDLELDVWGDPTAILEPG